MYGQVIFHPRPDSSLKAAEVSFRLASGTKWRLAERRVAMVRLLVARHQYNGARRVGQGLSSSHAAGR